MNLFLYGTLLDEALFDAIAGPGDSSATPALLRDHVVERVADTDLPMLIARPGGEAHGVIRSGLTAEQRTRLDTYEIAFGYQLRVVRVEAGTGAQKALAYFPPEAQRSDGTGWHLSDWSATARAPSLLAAEELSLHQPPLTPKGLGRQWTMIERRAAARHRAAREPVPPATVRRDAAPGDWAVTRMKPLAGRFFKLASFDVNHRSFDGTRSDDLSREVLLGIDAALVLPYDAARDRLLLVEQVRMGPLMRHDPNPWCLEPVAGMVDANETPEECALRETGEEAGLVPHALECMFRIYASPGSSTDFFHCYLGHCDLPDDRPWTGGLASESEDLRLHVLDFGRAMRLVETGEANAAPLVAMLLWLAANRDRLRAAA